MGMARRGLVKKEWQSSCSSWRSWICGVLLLWWMPEVIVEMNGRASAMVLSVAVIMPVTVAVVMARVADAVVMRVGRLVFVRREMYRHSCCRR